MSEVFDNPEDVMLKFLQRVFDKIIYVSDKTDQVLSRQFENNRKSNCLSFCSGL